MPVSTFASVALMVISSSCASPQETTTAPAPQEPQGEPATTTNPQPTTIQTTTPTTTAPVIAEGSYRGLGFAIQPPEGWTIIDGSPVEDDFLRSVLPVERTDVIKAQLDMVFGSGALLAFYDFSDASNDEYLSNMTLTKQPTQKDPDLTQQAEGTAELLRQSGYRDVSYSLDRVRAGEIVAMQYVSPAARSGTPSDLYISTTVVFAGAYTWTVTGIATGSPEPLATIVLQTAGSLQET